MNVRALSRTAVTRRTFLKVSAHACGMAALTPVMINRGWYRLFDDSSKEYSARAIRLVTESLVIDMLSPLSLGGARWTSNPDTFTSADASTFHDSGINVFHPGVGLGNAPGIRDRSLVWMTMYNGLIASRPDVFMRIDSIDDISHSMISDKIGVLLGLQDSAHFLTVDDVSMFYAVGQRISQLTYNARNLIGNGCTERRDDGISNFGVAIIERMNQVGMAIDVSHCGDRTSLDAFEISKKPVLVTHSNARALVPGQPRCKPDDVIKAVGKAGSVMGISGVRNFVAATEPTTIENVLDHFDYVSKLIGPEHVGVGSDSDLHGYDNLPPQRLKAIRDFNRGFRFRDRLDIDGLNHPKRMFDLTDGLIRRKYTDSQIRGILGENAKRVLSEIWKPSIRAPGAGGREYK